MVLFIKRWEGWNQWLWRAVENIWNSIGRWKWKGYNIFNTRTLMAPSAKAPSCSMGYWSCAIIILPWLLKFDYQFDYFMIEHFLLLLWRFCEKKFGNTIWLESLSTIRDLRMEKFPTRWAQIISLTWRLKNFKKLWAASMLM